MPFTRIRLAAIFFVFLSSFLSPARISSQTASDYRASEGPTLRASPQSFSEKCAPRLASRPGFVHFATESDPLFSAKAWSEGWTLSSAPAAACNEAILKPPSDGPLPLTNSLPASIPARPAVLPSVDPASSELASLGKFGVPVARARQEVLEILSSQNACSEWLATKDPAPADTFRSLSFTIDRHGPDLILESNSSSGPLLYFRQPYVARATQDGGPYTSITLNVNGAFFREQGSVQKVTEDGGAVRLDGTHLLTVGSYMGTTLQAQVVTLLHEFGHVIDLLPEDADNLDGRSSRNTDEVLRHCRAQVDAFSRLSRSSAKR